MSAHGTVSGIDLDGLPDWAQRSFAADCVERVAGATGDAKETCGLAIKVLRWSIAGASLPEAQTCVADAIVAADWKAAGSQTDEVCDAICAVKCALLSLPPRYARLALSAVFHARKVAPDEWKWQDARLAQYQRGEVPRPAMPTRFDLKPLLTHADRAVREEAIRALALLTGRS